MSSDSPCKCERREKNANILSVDDSIFSGSLKRIARIETAREIMPLVGKSKSLCVSFISCHPSHVFSPGGWYWYWRREGKDMIRVYSRSHVSSRLSFELLIIFHVELFLCKVVVDIIDVGLLTVFAVQQTDSQSTVSSPFSWHSILKGTLVVKTERDRKLNIPSKTPLDQHQHHRYSCLWSSFGLHLYLDLWSAIILVNKKATARKSPWILKKSYQDSKIEWLMMGSRCIHSR